MQLYLNVRLTISVDKISSSNVLNVLISDNVTFNTRNDLDSNIKPTRHVCKIKTHLTWAKTDIWQSSCNINLILIYYSSYIFFFNHLFPSEQYLCVSGF